jgi:3-methylcrotonyl-CoA carboxylase alpha subunit
VFRKILIANRGEIACRVAKTARRMGIRVAAVYSDADANARHVSFADEAFASGRRRARKLPARDAILDAAQRCGAEAIHPGYGFPVGERGLRRGLRESRHRFHRPAGRGDRAMGDKARAKALMAKAGVPIVPAITAKSQDAGLLLGSAPRSASPC